MGMKGNLSKGNLKDMVRQNTIKNCPVTTNAIIDARAIFGPDLPSQRGKTVRKTLVPIVADYVTVPREVVEQNKMVRLAADVFFVNRIAYL